MRSPLASTVLVILALSACNDAPTEVLARIGPELARSTDDLTVEILSPARDSQGDPVEYMYTWTVDGGATDITSGTVPADRTSKGETWKVTIVPTDGKAEAAPFEAQIVVGNTPPEATISAEVSSLKSTEPLEVTGSGTDADGDTVEMQYYWRRNGEGTPFDGPRVPSAFTYPGERWVAYAVAFDGEERGEPATHTFEILNGEPIIDSLVLSPVDGEVYADTDLTATVQAHDPDGQNVRLTYTWTVDGSQVQRGTDLNTLSASSFRKHQVVQVTVTPFDGVDEGTPMAADVTVANTPPTAPEVTILPEEPIPGIDDMTCAVAAPSSDTDDDTVSYTIQWFVDGVEYTGAFDGDLPGDTVPAYDIDDKTEWSCTIIPADDDGVGPSASTEVFAEIWSGPRMFTPCGSTGSKGPDQGDCDSGDGYLGTTLEDEVVVTDGIQAWEVPVTGTYRILAYGAMGGTTTSGRYGYTGGPGASLAGTFDLTRGDVVYIAVGQQGKTDGGSAGGGGATWVMTATDTPMMVAGGGGGLSYYGDYYARKDGCSANTTVYGRYGSGSSYSSTSGCGVKTSARGLGGTSPGSYCGNGGAGLNGDGADDPYTFAGGTGGSSWANGAEGGTGAAAGGFGGGGGGNGSYGAGGGGGYSGGDAGRARAGGGGSYNAGSSPSITLDNYDEGSVEIDLLAH